MVIALAACGGSVDGTGSSTAATAPSALAEAPTTTPTSSKGTAPSSFAGIIAATCSGGGSQALQALDPVSGQSQERVFSLSANLAPQLGCASTISTGQILRQQFNDDFTQMAVSSRGDPDGSVLAGYVDTSGNFTNLTPAATGFSDVPTQYAAVYNPTDGRLWFQTDSAVGSVDPDQGPSSSRVEPGEPSSNYVTGGVNAFYFTPDGKARLGLLGAYDVYSLDGRIMVEYAAPYGYRVGRAGEVSDSAPVISVPQLCWPKWFMGGQSADSFLCAGISDRQIYTMTVSPDQASITQTPLLPRTNREIGDVIASADGTQIAFVSKAGSTYGLYITTTAGGDEPRQVASLPEGTSLIDWNG
jgi:hypothetical protein